MTEIKHYLGNFNAVKSEVMSFGKLTGGVFGWRRKLRVSTAS